MSDLVHRDLARAAEEQFVRKAQDLETFLRQPSIASCIMSLLGRFVVHRAVELDDEPSLEADEIGHIGSERALAPEFQAEAAPVAQLAPQSPLGACACAALRLGEFS